MSFGQTISGVVFGQNEGEKLPLVGAQIWQQNNYKTGATTNANGEFRITLDNFSNPLIVSYVGYKTDTVFITNANQKIEITLKTDASMMKNVVVNVQRQGFSLKSRSVETTFELRESEFQKAACCNLSESFENAPAIDVAFTDAVTGTKQIKMLGLDGVYTSISREFMPSVRGLNTFYGLSFIPAAWVDGIQITKGAGSVVNGFESMAGQINVELKKPFGNQLFLFDFFTAQSGRTEADLMLRRDLSQYVATSVFGRFSVSPFSMDRNGDGFRDNPTGNQMQWMNRWQFYNKSGVEGQANVSYNHDQKLGGQVGGESPYLVNIGNEQLDAWAKLGKSYKDKPYKSFGSQYAFSSINTSTSYGNDTNSKLLNLDGKSFYVNLMYQNIFGNTNHEYKTGVSFLGDINKEQLETILIEKQEYTPGAYFEYTLKIDSALTLVSGIRADYSSLFGLFMTGRVHFKYSFNKKNTTVRISGGNGHRTPNFLAQNQQLFISNQSVSIIKKANEQFGVIQEISQNQGISIQHKTKLRGYMPTTFVVDFFKTDFKNELLVNRENWPNGVVFSSLKNGLRANSFQFQMDVKPLRRTEIRLAYRLFDVTTVYEGVRKQLPYVSKHRGFINITQQNRKKWQFSTTANLVGAMRTVIPTYVNITTDPNPVYETEPFLLWNGQVSKKIKKNIETYIGVENILNVRQRNPISSSANPFGTTFDAAGVYGPIFGRMFYGGFRYRIIHEKEHND
ncbi:MAG: TonB-dependent receptor [Flavobacteriales bacterium]|nr:TonB-dependent receptor [Flavobacteriales bacterium]